MMRFPMAFLVLCALPFLSLVTGCKHHPCEGLVPTRAEAIPVDIVKGTPNNDDFPPQLHSDEFEEPVTWDSPITAAGAEDSPYFSRDGSTFVFFFAPDVRVPVELQLQDCTVGLWQSTRQGDRWSEPVRLLLSDDLALDGCPAIQEDRMWFCSVRVGNHGEIDAWNVTRVDDGWTDWEHPGPEMQDGVFLGEWDFSPDGNRVYFGAELPGGHGGEDLWFVDLDGDTWGDPVNLGPAVNDDRDQVMPHIRTDGTELWWNADSKQGGTGPGTWRSVAQPDGSWGPAEEIVGNFAGEPTLDADGNLYFVHHYVRFPEGGGFEIIEADIFVATRK